MWRDEHTGLYHTHYREYNPVLGRWLSPDPAGYVDGQNLYNYYPNVNGVDPLGLSVQGKASKVKIFVKKSGDAIEGIFVKGPKRFFHAKLIGQKVDVGDILHSGYKHKIAEFSKKYGKVSFPGGLLDLKRQAHKIRSKGKEIALDIRIPDDIILKGTAKADGKLAIEQLKKRYPKLKLPSASEMKNFTWHHGPDRQMQLVPKELHDAIRHTGYAAVIKNTGKAVVGILFLIALPSCSQGGFTEENIVKDGFELLDSTGTSTVIIMVGDEIGDAFNDLSRFGKIAINSKVSYTKGRTEADKILEKSNNYQYRETLWESAVGIFLNMCGE